MAETKAASYTRQLELLNKHRDLVNKAFIEKETGDKFQLLMFALSPAYQLTAVMCLCSHTPFKIIVHMDTFDDKFEPFISKEHE